MPINATFGEYLVQCWDWKLYKVDNPTVKSNISQDQRTMNYLATTAPPPDKVMVESIPLMTDVGEA